MPKNPPSVWEINHLPQARDLKNWLTRILNDSVKNYLLLGDASLASLSAKPIFADTGFYIRKPEADYAISTTTQPDGIEEPSVLPAFDSHDRDSEELRDLLSV